MKDEDIKTIQDAQRRLRSFAAANRELDAIQGANAMIGDYIENLRRWIADCAQPALAEKAMSREFCRCERCCDRRERRSGVERRDPKKTHVEDSQGARARGTLGERVIPRRRAP